MSSDSDEDYAEYGIGLEQLDEESLPRKKPFSLGDQIATDEHGRRRFHGAFTGGFSAGFFNSVGSLEGWKPSNFKSSRSEKAAIKSQKPEDFMDDEDMGEFGIAPKVLRASRDYRSSQKRERTHHTCDGPIPGEPVLQQLLKPTRETVGVKLLKKMGWKPGQGIGPRVTKKEKKQMKEEYSIAAVKVYGCSLPEQQMVVQLESSSEEDEEDVEALLTFAPEDMPAFLCKPKDNSFGLGYIGLDRRPILSGHINLFAPSSLKMEEKKKKVSISGQAFGVGVLEEDDEDIYAQEDMSQYDFTMDSSTSKSSRRSRFSEVPALANYAGDVLEGFLLSSKHLLKKKFFPPPSLPQGYQPLHTTRVSRFEPAKDTFVDQAKKKGLQRHKFTATERLHILNSAAKNADTNSLEEEQKVLKAEALKITESTSSSNILGGSSYGFRPFAAHPEKQERYEKFLALSKLGQKERLCYFQPVTMTEWEKERERVEFEQAAKLYRPLSGLMSDRFVSATHSDDDPAPGKVTETHSDQKAAAKVKMFGLLTREESDWRPCSLLCKRFNIPELYPGQGDISSSTKKKPTFSIFDFLEDSVKPKTEAVPDNEERVENEDEDDVEVAELPICNDKTEEQDSEEVKTKKDASLEFSDPPAKIDLYKAIFLSSSSSSSEDSESDEKEDKVEPGTNIPQPNTSSTKEPVVAPTPKANINSSPPRGVFANLDLDAIISRRKDRIVEQPSASRDSTCSENSSSAKETLPQSVNMYGPSLPSTGAASQDKAEKPANKPLTSIVAIPNAVWVEKTKESHKTKHHKKHKKTSKHKKHKSKTKHKKKKH